MFEIAKSSSRLDVMVCINTTAHLVNAGQSETTLEPRSGIFPERANGDVSKISLLTKLKYFLFVSSVSCWKYSRTSGVLEGA